MPLWPNPSYAFAEAFVEELARCGLRHVCLCPGSRSTPLVLSLARQGSLKAWIHLDERSAAYFALGMARGLAQPVAVVCTSGTAAANFFPAVVEARYARVPLLVLTADRPPELREWGANQTIDQTRMYGSHVKWSVNLAQPEAEPHLLRYVRAMACRAFSVAAESPAGPVHVNFPFREPLVPENLAAEVQAPSPAGDREIWEGRSGGQAYLQSLEGRRRVGREQLRALAEDLRGVKRGLIVCGPQEEPGFPETVAKLAARLGFPLLADPLSQVRCGRHDRRLVIDCYDALLRESRLAQALSPQVVLRFGAVPTSQALLSYLQRHSMARQIIVDEGAWPDPIHVATDIFRAEPTGFAMDLSALVQGISDVGWAGLWLKMAEAARKAVDDQLQSIQELFEGKIFSELGSLLPDRATLFAGNSMPVRDMDVFFPSTAHQVRCAGNRGGSGIDGVISTALGFSAVSQDPLVLVVGDLSFYHDTNGLFAARQNRLKATIILVNNDGGGIFSFLPQRNYPDYFETYFGTPHGLAFKSAASLYGLDFYRASSWKEFRDSVSKSMSAPATSIVEVVTDREKNVELHRRIWSAVSRAVEPFLREAT